MAVIYYPTESEIIQRITTETGFTQIIIDKEPATVLYFSSESNQLFSETLNITASRSITASYALNGGGSGTSLSTGSSYPVTASWAINVVNGSTGTVITTGSSYPITSSVALKSISASYAPYTDTNTWLTTGSTYPVTASVSLRSISASYAPYVDTNTWLVTGSTYPITASVALKSISASYAPYTDTNTWLVTASLYPITASKSISSSYSPLEPFASASIVNQLNAKQASLVTGTTYTITSSVALIAVSASYAPNTDTNTWLTTGSLYPITASRSVTSISSSYSSVALTASYALNGGVSGTSAISTGSSYPITSSWALKTQTASFSYASVTSDFSITSTYCDTASYATRHENFGFALSDSGSDLFVQTYRESFRMPWAGTLTKVRSNLMYTSSNTGVVLDINKNGTSVLSTKLWINPGQLTSVTATTQSVIVPASSSFADDDLVSFDIDQVGSGTTGKGLKVYLYFTQT